MAKTSNETFRPGEKQAIVYVPSIRSLPEGEPFFTREAILILLHVSLKECKFLMHWYGPQGWWRWQLSRLTTFVLDPSLSGTAENADLSTS